MRSFTLIAIVVSLLLAPATWAFRGHEHTDLGNDALAMAIGYLLANERYWCSETRTENCLDQVDLERLERMLPDGDRITYGDVCAAVDHVVNPIKFFERTGYVACYPTDVEQLYASHVLGHSQLLAWRASHVNDMHFQGEGMASFWLWHNTGVTASASGECLPRPGLAIDNIPDADQTVDTLIGALVVNAIGDHFLQDHFAPGHVFTFRDTLGDYSSLSNHDRYNVLGAVYLVHKGRWLAELKPLLTEAGIAAQQHLTAEAVAAGVANIEDGYTLNLWGDDNLWRSDDQRLFQVLLGARSILDVIDAYVSGVSANHLGQYYWEQMKIVDKQLELPIAGLPYGRYAPHRRRSRSLPRGTVAHISFSGQGFGEFSGESAFAGLTDLEFSYGYFTPGRKLRSGALEPRIYEWDVALGYSWLEGSDYSARGPSARLIFSVPIIDMRFSADTAYRKLHGLGTEVNKLAYSLRWELGFALAAMHLAVGSDHFITSTGAVEQSPILRYGVTFSLPMSRIPVIEKMTKARWRKKRAKFLSRFTIPEQNLDY